MARSNTRENLQPGFFLMAGEAATLFYREKLRHKLLITKWKIFTFCIDSNIIPIYAIETLKHAESQYVQGF